MNLKFAVFLTALALVNVLAKDALASSVRAMQFDELSAKAEVVFEGRVAQISHHTDSYGRVFTDVVFDVVQVIKGSVPDKQLTLTFLGGKSGKKTLKVSDLNYPQLGEEGIYFVESLDKTYVNPLLGWDQGRFLIDRDSQGKQRILAASKKPITSVQGIGTKVFKNSVDKQNLEKNSAESGLSNGLARGLSVGDSTSTEEAVLKDDFIKKIKEAGGE